MITSCLRKDMHEMKVVAIGLNNSLEPKEKLTLCNVTLHKHYRYILKCMKHLFVWIHWIYDSKADSNIPVSYQLSLSWQVHTGLEKRMEFKVKFFLAFYSSYEGVTKPFNVILRRNIIHRRTHAINLDFYDDMQFIYTFCFVCKEKNYCKYHLEILSRYEAMYKCIRYLTSYWN